jgi:SAM-dependent MidA family methyltransferase
VDLTAFIKEKMEQNNWMSMEDFMGIALYHRDEGYYMKQKKKIGKNGDFYTSSSVSDVFGKVWADVFARTIIKQQLDPAIVEFGSGNGNFAKHVLTALKENGHDHITYIIIEKSLYHRQLLKENLKRFPVVVMSTFEELQEAHPSFKGIIFANEVLDAFPIRIFQNTESKWNEKVVVFDNRKNKFVFDSRKVENIDLVSNLNEIFSSRSKNFIHEVSFQMHNWLRALYEWADEKCCFFFVDYGYKGEEWNHIGLKEGSVRGYYRHKIENDPLSFPGEMDITHHIDWDQVERTAKEHYVETVGFYSQGEFLLNEGLLTYLNNTKHTDPFSSEHKRNRAVRSFLLDGSLANGFQVIQQTKRTV